MQLRPGPTEAHSCSDDEVNAISVAGHFIEIGVNSAAVDGDGEGRASVARPGFHGPR